MWIQRSAADQILRDLQNNADMWLQVVHILQNTKNLNTKFFALQVRCSLKYLVWWSNKEHYDVYKVTVLMPDIDFGVE